MKGWLIAALALTLFIWLCVYAWQQGEPGGFTPAELRGHRELMDRALAAARHHKPNLMTRAERDRGILYLFEDQSLALVNHSVASGEPDGQ